MRPLPSRSAAIVPIPAAPTPDSRSEPRIRTLFAIGRIVTADRELVCLVRNMSESGLGIEHSSDLPEGVDVMVETRSMPPTRAIVRWSEGRMAGLEFVRDETVVISPVEADRPEGQHARSPRFTLDRPVHLLVGVLRIEMRALDIALGGLKLEGTLTRGFDAPAKVVIDPDGRVRHGRICWHAAGTIGFQFSVPLTSGELAAILTA